MNFRGGIVLETEGKVLRVSGRSAIVEVRRKSACSGNCVDCSGCQEQTMEVSAFTELAVLPGDRVRLSSDQKSILLGMFILFILPLALPATVYLLTMKSGLGILFAFIALAAALALIVWFSKNRWFLERTKPRIIEVISEKRETK